MKYSKTIRDEGMFSHEDAFVQKEDTDVQNCQTKTEQSYVGDAELDMLHDRIFNYYKSFQLDISDDRINEVISKFTDFGTFIDIEYNKSWSDIETKEKYAHLYNLRDMVFAYRNHKSIYFSSALLFKQIVKALNFWIFREFIDNNAKHRTVGFPNVLIGPFILIADELKVKDPNTYIDTVLYLKYSWNDCLFYNNLDMIIISKFVVATAIIDKDRELVRTIIDKLSSKLIVGDVDHGILPDYSFTYKSSYGRQMHLMASGIEILDGILYFVELMQGTKYEFSNENVEALDNLFTHIVRWSWYKGNVDDSQCGRFILRDIIRSGKAAETLTTLLIRLISLKTPACREHIKTLMMMKEKIGITGNMFFHCQDYMIHRGKNFWTSVRMTSTRTVGNESGNGEGNLNYHTGHGVNYIKVHGNEYRELSSKWNWQMLPGITAVVDNRTLIKPEWGLCGGNDDAFAGGASDGNIGLCAFKFSKKQDLTFAQKAWFFLGDYYVCLGTGITTYKATGQLITTINQTLEKNSSELHINGSKERRFWNNDIGYVISAETANYNEVNVNINELDGYRIFLLSINHGIKPTEAKYHYTVFPGISYNELQRIESMPYEVLSNTKDVQAIRDLKTGIVMSVFYSRAVISIGNGMSLSVNRPCFIIYKSDDDFIATSPYGGGSIEVVVNVI